MKSGKKPALGAAFSHARAVEAKTGGGKKKQRRVAMRYLHARGEGISKSATTFGQYRDAMAQAQQDADRNQADDRYAWSAYQALFQRNHDALAQLRQDEMLRRYGKR